MSLNVKKKKKKLKKVWKKILLPMYPLDYRKVDFVFFFIRFLYAQVSIMR